MASSNQNTTLDNLRACALNLRWCWHPKGEQLWRSLFPERWAESGNPAVLVKALDGDNLPDWTAEQIEELDRFAKELDAEQADKDTWYLNEGHPLEGPVAYFSAEYGLHESLPIYSGGLGVLAGDHLKSTSDLGIPLVAIGLLYRNGYVRQHIDAAGTQLANYPHYDFADLAIERVTEKSGAPVQVSVPIAGNDCAVQVWKARVGRVTLYLLDTDLEENQAELRQITQRLYGGGSDTRIKQELILGVGGVRMLDSLGITPGLFHLNEGHSSFLSLERLRCAVQDRGEAYDEALGQIRRTSLFTTHTPVEAGHDRFQAGLFLEHMSWMADGLGIDNDALLTMGRWPDNQDPAAEFNMTLCALHTCGQVNGVAALHGEVSREMFARYWPGCSAENAPIAHVTNGVHRPTWQNVRLWGLMGDCDPDEPDSYRGRVDAVDDYSLWYARNGARSELVDFVERRGNARAHRLGIKNPPRLNPDALTIGFARRFATYKRADLLFGDIDRLAYLLDQAPGPVQFIFAGKAHPADVPGQGVLRRVYEASLDPRLHGRVILMEDYDMEMGRQLTKGVDVWLNTPRRPKEASGTSGMKAAMNGGLNLSILDGWWPEGYDGKNGWVIGDEHRRPVHEQDEFDLNALCFVLEQYVFPLFYDRDSEGVPAGWVRMMRAAISSVTPVFNSDRQVGDYFRNHYRKCPL